MPRYSEGSLYPDQNSVKSYDSENVFYGFDAPVVISPGPGEVVSSDLLSIRGEAEPGLGLIAKTYIWAYLSADDDDIPLNASPWEVGAVDTPYGSSPTSYLDKGFFQGYLDFGTGSVDVYLRAENAYDSAYSSPTLVTLTRDVVYPSVAISTIATSDKIVRGTASDIGSDIQQVYIILSGGLESDYGYGNVGGDIFYAQVEELDDGTYIWKARVDNLVLGAYNTIQVVAVDSGGLETTISGSVLYETIAPLVSFSRTKYGSNFLYGSYTNLGTVEQPFSSDVARISVDNQSATFRDGNWAVSLAHLGDGTHLIKAKIWDVAGNESSTELSISIVFALPIAVINISDYREYEGKYYTNQNEISGYFRANSNIPLVSVELNEEELISEDTYNGTFRRESSLVEGENEITLSAVNQAGSRSTTSIAVVYDTVAPQLLSSYAVAENKIQLLFDEILREESLHNAKAYKVTPRSLQDPRAKELTPIGFETQPKGVILEFDNYSLADNDYDVAMRGLEDLAGNVL